MLAFARLQRLPLEDYIHPRHPIQQRILETFAEMCDLPVEGISPGTDGCSAPNFAVPLYNAALAFARLCDPATGEVGSALRAEICRTVSSAMASHPEMVAGPGRFDTRLMAAAGGRFVAKGGAEGYQCIGLLPGAFGRGSPALGIAIKISDGDPKSRACPAVALEILSQLGALAEEDRDLLAEFGPELPVYNWRRLLVGRGQPCFEI
jgi:L-asparaginase II